jgi:hypothetical protein
VIVKDENNGDSSAEGQGVTLGPGRAPITFLKFIRTSVYSLEKICFKRSLTCP